MRMRFNPSPHIRSIAVGGGHACHVIDDVLMQPGQWVDFAAEQAAAFTPSGHNAYPGPELRLADAVSAELDAFFATHLRRLFGVRRTLRMYSRMSLVTTPPAQLAPRQWQCHVDRLEVEPGQRLAASVLYLFHDARLGGTSFYRPLRPLAEIAQLVRDSDVLDADAFRARHRVDAGYMTASNAYFEKVLTVPAQWNRMIVYDGSVFHCGEISAPDRLSADPRVGRLTLNGFFICRRELATARARQ